MFFLLSLFLATAKLPLIEIPATRGGSDSFVVFVSGDGGWAKIDKSISAILASNGMPVVGVNSLQYFWTKRTPDSAARDLQSIIETHLGARKSVVLVGYSRGADVLPAMIARMPQETQSKIRLLVLLAPSPRVEFEFHVADWMRDTKRGMLVKPELERVKAKTLCVWGEDDRDSLCTRLALPNVQVVTLRGSHHFEGDYAQLAKIILEALK